MAAAACLIAVAVAGCEYAAQPTEPGGSAAVEAGSASHAPAAGAGTASGSGAGALRGQTELNSYYLAVRYTCVDGDTWEAVAHEFGMDTDVLKNFNKAETLRAGAVIDLRGKETPQPGAGGSFTANPDGTSTYTVEANDTFSGISSRFGVPADALRGANVSLSGKGAELLAAPGDQLAIPSTR